MGFRYNGRNDNFNENFNDNLNENFNGNRVADSRFDDRFDNRFCRCDWVWNGCCWCWQCGPICNFFD